MLLKICDWVRPLLRLAVAYGIIKFSVLGTLNDGPLGLVGARRPALVACLALRRRDVAFVTLLACLGVRAAALLPVCEPGSWSISVLFWTLT